MMLKRINNILLMTNNRLSSLSTCKEQELHKLYYNQSQTISLENKIDLQYQISRIIAIKDLFVPRKEPSTIPQIAEYPLNSIPKFPSPNFR